MTTTSDDRTSVPQPAPIAAADREVKPPLVGKPVDQLVTSGAFRVRLPGALSKVTDLRVRVDARIAVSEQAAGSKGLDYEFHAGPHSTLREGVVTIDRCRLSLGADLLDQGACAEAGWAGVIRPLGGMPPIRTIRISPGRPKLLAPASSFMKHPYSIVHLIEPGADAATGLEYLMLIALPNPVKLDLLLLDPSGKTIVPFTLASGSPLRLDRAANTLTPAPATLEPWATDALRRACRHNPRLCT